MKEVTKMSKYTTELRYFLDNEKMFPPSESDLALTNILKNYPIENENFLDPTRKDSKTRREALNEKIINHYYFREIGFETVPRFLFALQRRLNEIMVLYNQKYQSIDLNLSYIDNVNMTETFSHTIDDTSTTTSSGDSSNGGSNTTTNENLNVENDTPATELTDADIKGNKFATRTNHVNDTSTVTLGTNSHSEGTIGLTGKKTETYTRTEKGSSKGFTFAQNVSQWRDIMINVETEIINELNDLFMISIIFSTAILLLGFGIIGDIFLK
jgi:hypothetical protein